MPDAVLPPISPPLKWWVQPFLAFALLFGFLGVTGLIVWRSDDKYEQMVIVALISLITGALGYYFGSSSSSAKKDDVNAAQSAALATSTPASASGPSGDDAASLAQAVAESQAAHT